MIKVKINNEGSLELIQEVINRKELITLKSIDNSGNTNRKDKITEGDFVMLMNYYRYVKDNNIKCDFINPHGINTITE